VVRLGEGGGGGGGGAVSGNGTLALAAAPAAAAAAREAVGARTPSTTVESSRTSFLSSAEEQHFVHLEKADLFHQRGRQGSRTSTATASSLTRGLRGQSLAVVGGLEHGGFQSRRSASLTTRNDLRVGIGYARIISGNSEPDEDSSYPEDFLSEDDDGDVESSILALGGAMERKSARALSDIRHKLEHNFFSRSVLEDKLQIFETLNDCVRPEEPDWNVRLSALELVRDILPHLGPDADTCMNLVVANAVPCQGSNRIRLQQAAAQVLQRYLKFCTDIQSVLRSVHGKRFDTHKITLVHASVKGEKEKQSTVH
jgi:hypothetical protein